MPDRSYNVGEAKRELSDLLGRVAYGGETILITKRGRPMAKLVPVRDEARPHLADAEGWLDDDDDFFETMASVTATRGFETMRPASLDEEV